MKRKTIPLLAAGLVLAACSTVPLTGRKQLSLVSSGELMQMANSQYDQFLDENKVIKGTADANRVKNIGNKLARAVETYMNQNGYSENIEGFQWEFNLISSEQKNAFCMPGGKVAVYTGILPVCKTDAGLATVMGHEIAHAIAHHGGERMSQSLAAMGVQLAANVALSEKDPQVVNTFNSLYGVGANVGYLLPNSRRQESEADRLGLIFMAMAGYDPSASVGFWQRMSAGGGGKPPEFLSTHPSDERRIRDIQQHIPEAMKYYRK
ncbi:peptidase M48-like protein [Anseongella ginsenosidimutans]|uniref:Peptidase M48-like protein n=1 Tax=Anseongella ginsenosidimutans TaxID=496056 RepID=A0A4V2UTX2_9SPHI|nr:M48 family metallopeptidase [Anseongella ginsenosidimutans]QEC53281.1 M48 family metallopeptidase [Anseongella ginsenosidimutans]TCS88152.1 peptidase M48-like protein [Anseongella ginsenosidimutans]